MSKLRGELSDLFSSQVFVRKLGKGKIKVIDSSRLQLMARQKPLGYGSYRGLHQTYGTGVTGNARTVLGFNTNKPALYADYEAMDLNPLIFSALDIYADECTVQSPKGDLITIKCQDENIKSILHNLFYDILNVEFNLWSWIRNFCKYGDFYLELNIKPKIGIINVNPISPYVVEREEGYNLENPFEYRFKISDGRATKLLNNFEVAHFRMLSDTNFLPFGKSILEGGRKVFKALVLMEDSMLLQRIMRAPERRKIKVDVGNIPPEEVDNYMKKIIDSTKKVPYLDPATGDYNLKFNMMNMLEDFYLPVRGQDSGTDIEALPGLENQGQIEDIEYLRSQLLSALKVPKAFLNDAGDVEGKTTLAAQDMSFARTIERIQKMFLSELDKIAKVHLFSLGFSGEQLICYELKLSSPSILYQRQKVDLLTEQVNLINSMKETKMFPNKYIYEQLLEWTEEEWLEAEDLVVEDTKKLFRLNQIETEGNDPEVTSKSFGTPHDIATMHVASKLEGDGDEGGRPEEIKKFGTKKDYLGKDIDGNKELSNTKMDKEPVSQTFKGGSPLDISSFMKKFGKDQEIIQESLKKYVEDNLEVEKSVKFLNEDILK